MKPRVLEVLVRQGSYLLALILAVSCYAQFSASVQGTVQDPAGAIVPNAKIQLKNLETAITATTNADREGSYRFVSLSPGAYTLTVESPGFSTSTVKFTLETSQNLNVPVAMKLASSTQTV